MISNAGCGSFEASYVSSNHRFSIINSWRWETNQSVKLIFHWSIIKLISSHDLQSSLPQIPWCLSLKRLILIKEIVIKWSMIIFRLTLITIIYIKRHSCSLALIETAIIIYKSTISIFLKVLFPYFFSLSFCILCTCFNVLDDVFSALFI